MVPDFYTVDELTAVCLARTIKDSDIVVADDVQSTPPPTPIEVALIRKLDPLNVRKRLFSAEQLQFKMEF